MPTAAERPISRVVPGDRRKREPRRWFSGWAMRMMSASVSIWPKGWPPRSRVAPSNVCVIPLSWIGEMSMSSVSESPRDCRTLRESERCLSSMGSKAGLENTGQVVKKRITGLERRQTPEGFEGSRCHQRLDAPREVVRRAVDGAADGEGFEVIHGVGDEERLELFGVLHPGVEPESEILPVEDHRHAVVDGAHQLVRAGGE